MGAHRATAIAATIRYKVLSVFDVPFFPREGELKSCSGLFPPNSTSCISIKYLLRWSCPTNFAVTGEGAASVLHE
jgi:hypothetical protein